jgi:hypothetical protein
MNDANTANPRSIKVKLDNAKIRLTELETIITKAESTIASANQEKEKISYMLSYLDSPSDDQDIINGKNNNVTSIPHYNKRAVYLQIAQENMNKTLSGNEILNIIRGKGILIKKTTHHANLSLFSKDNQMPIKRASLGQYTFAQKTPQLLQ